MIHFNATDTNGELIFQQLYFTKKDQSLKNLTQFWDREF
ncbi:hypothetical protein LEP1GSC080_2569 [Leptospira interrogans str. FPW2026]|nr:hypothetical protein LEP1GSC080_2569 [Leptospira interrogans str. FPW2026]